MDSLLQLLETLVITATTLTSGVIGYPRGEFVAFAALAAVLWASYNVAIGMIGGLAFRENPQIGVVLGVGLALVVGILVDRLRIARNRRRRARRLPVVFARRLRPARGSARHSSSEAALACFAASATGEEIMTMSSRCTAERPKRSPIRSRSSLVVRPAIARRSSLE